jgi:O-acetyl-ADP-ribose deacetylase (regulator of RNase III)
VRSSFRHSLALARERGCRSIAAPAIGAGIGGFPMQRCAEVMLEEARRFLERTQDEEGLAEIRFVLLGEPAYRIFEMVNDAARVAEQMERLRSR